uniref:Uncharacterized protein n=1 Tax=Sinocyclocheilus grahami TaxID=75366 RepID=A0A672KZ72_SINGR
MLCTHSFLSAVGLISSPREASYPPRFPSVQTTCSGHRDCTVVCTLVRLCGGFSSSLNVERKKERKKERKILLDGKRNDDLTENKSLFSEYNCHCLDSYFIHLDHKEIVLA